MTARGPLAFALVALGGAIGACLRHAVALAMTSTWPRGTMIVNVSGCFAMGLLLGLFGNRIPEGARLFLAVGVLGGYTTFSAFGADVVLGLESRKAMAVGYAAGTVVFGIAAVIAGQRLGAWLKR